MKFKLCIALINKKLRSNPYFLPCITDSTCRPANNEVTKNGEVILDPKLPGGGGGGGHSLILPIRGCAAVHSMAFYLSALNKKFESGVTESSIKLCYQPLLKK